MKKLFAAVLGMALAVPAFAQMSPVGLWRNMDDKTGEAKAEVRVTEEAGGLKGSIEKVLKKNANPADVCAECSGDRKDKPIVGLEIIRGGKKEADKDVWSGGKIIDPENGKEYRASFTPTEGGAKLEVRGYLGPFWRTQTWQRVN
ncbi:DUF2147 domain-containing protein [Diaphorobacter sp. HDW4A]|uniref:DUF2147 domain-containing protein n=1 Tax=Diaphorobacter sp. HDW4A TaxID=2714924 RepID=UPI00140BF41D|nr:DUF2147 domain-containing protein [Diaphorobacter sp. HDW4A]QIL81801.1 DUF2147 domain-containing protein [Diaphorobacter sp. HDW4A]